MVESGSLTFQSWSELCNNEVQRAWHQILNWIRREQHWLWDVNWVKWETMMPCLCIQRCSLGHVRLGNERNCGKLVPWFSMNEGECCCLVAKLALLRPHGLYPNRLLYPWEFPGKNPGLGCHFLLQGIFPTQGLNPHLLHRQVESFPLSHPGSPEGRCREDKKMIVVGGGDGELNG